MNLYFRQQIAVIALFTATFPRSRLHRLAMKAMVTTTVRPPQWPAARTAERYVKPKESRSRRLSRRAASKCTSSIALANQFRSTRGAVQLRFECQAMRNDIAMTCCPTAKAR